MDTKLKYYLAGGQQCYHVCLQGGRPYREDKTVVIEHEGVVDLNNLSVELDKDLDTHKEKRQSGGAAGIMVSLDTQHRIKIANRGDCQASLFVYDPETTSIDVEILTKNIHNLSNPEEVKKYQDLGLKLHRNYIDKLQEENVEKPMISFGGTWSTWDKSLRLNGTLAVSRVFGDFDTYNELGENHGAKELFRTHEIIEKDISSIVSSGKRVFMLVTSDGYYDEGQHSVQALSSTLKHKFIPIVRNNIDKGAHEIGQAIKKAYQPKRGDNKSMYFVEITEACLKPVLFGIFDGHAGDWCAKALVESVQTRVKGKEPVLDHPRKPKAGGQGSFLYQFIASFTYAALSTPYLLNQSSTVLPDNAPPVVKAMYYGGVVAANIMLSSVIYKSLGSSESGPKKSNLEYVVIDPREASTSPSL